MRITYSECVFIALYIQHVKRICRIILSSLACQTLPHIFTLSKKGIDFFLKSYRIKNACFDFLYDFISHSKKNLAGYYHKHSQVFV